MPPLPATPPVDARSNQRWEHHLVVEWWEFDHRRRRRRFPMKSEREAYRAKRAVIEKYPNALVEVFKVRAISRMKAEEVMEKLAEVVL